MPKTIPEDEDEKEVFEMLGIDDEDDKKNVRLSAAARLLAAKKARKLKQPEPEKKSGRTLW